MIPRVSSTPILLAALLAAVAAGAATAPDAMRCQARELRCESDLYQCLSRCGQRSPQAAFPAGSRPVMATPTCDEACVDRYDDAMARIADSAACGVTEAPDPARCESRLLRAGAVRLTCAARCASRPGAAADCAARCDTRCSAAAAQILADAVCGGGRVGTAPPCGAIP